MLAQVSGTVHVKSRGTWDFYAHFSNDSSRHVMQIT